MKKGITFVSLVIYVVAFFTFIVIASSITSNLNRNNFKDRGYIEVNNSYLKLYANMFDSAKNSNFVNYIDNKYMFSNGDSYYFDKDKKIIMKNNGVLCYNVTNIKVNSNDIVDFNVDFSSYDNNLSREIILNVGDK